MRDLLLASLDCLADAILNTLRDIAGLKRDGALSQMNALKASCGAPEYFNRVTNLLASGGTLNEPDKDHPAMSIQPFVSNYLNIAEKR